MGIRSTIIDDSKSKLFEARFKNKNIEDREQDARSTIIDDSKSKLFEVRFKNRNIEDREQDARSTRL